MGTSSVSHMITRRLEEFFPFFNCSARLKDTFVEKSRFLTLHVAGPFDRRHRERPVGGRLLQ